METLLILVAGTALLAGGGWYGWLLAKRSRYPVTEHPGFLTDEECAHLIAVGEPALKKSKVIFSGQVGDDHIDRESATAFLDHGRDPIIQGIKKRIADLTGTAFEQQERLQVTHYGPNQRYDLHYDALRAALLEPGEEGDRIYTVILYLNDDFEGGATWFPRVRRRIQAERGKAVMFRNLVADGSRQERLAFHAGEPVQNGEKWLSNQWIRERPRKPGKSSKAGRPRVGGQRKKGRGKR